VPLLMCDWQSLSLVSYYANSKDFSFYLYIHYFVYSDICVLSSPWLVESGKFHFCWLLSACMFWCAIDRMSLTFLLSWRLIWFKLLFLSLPNDTSTRLVLWWCLSIGSVKRLSTCSLKSFLCWKCTSGGISLCISTFMTLQQSTK